MIHYDTKCWYEKAKPILGRTEFVVHALPDELKTENPLTVAGHLRVLKYHGLVDNIGKAKGSSGYGVVALWRFRP